MVDPTHAAPGKGVTATGSAAAPWRPRGVPHSRGPQQGSDGGGVGSGTVGTAWCPPLTRAQAGACGRIGHRQHLASKGG
jgi:hypothetical protein